MIVVDTGPLVALLDAGDRHHACCRTWLAEVERAQEQSADVRGLVRGRDQ